MRKSVDLEKSDGLEDPGYKKEKKAAKAQGSSQDYKKKPRRRFSASYKLKILQQADDCAATGDIGTLLKKEGLYFSNLTLWRKQRDEGLLMGLTPKKRGRKAKNGNPLSAKLTKLKKEKAKLEKKLRQAETIIEVQKKFFKDVANIPTSKRRKHLMNEAKALGKEAGAKAACSALGIPRASFYRFLNKEAEKQTEKEQKKE